MPSAKKQPRKRKPPTKKPPRQTLPNHPTPDPSPDPEANHVVSSATEDSPATEADEPRAAELDELAGAIGAAGGELSDEDAERLLDVADQLAEHPEALASMDTEDVALLIAAPFDYIAGRRGEHWKLTDHEKTRMAKWLAKVIVKYGWSWLEKFMPEIMTAAYFSAAIATRVAADRQIKADGDAVEKESGQRTPSYGELVQE